ncbi:hypothetical protein HWV62_29104 [Athelia sp. TMB]|nr:hypothetical protein HWV62_29104 [Athelia sp. TMB]
MHLQEYHGSDGASGMYIQFLEEKLLRVPQAMTIGLTQLCVFHHMRFDLTEGRRKFVDYERCIDRSKHKQETYLGCTVYAGTGVYRRWLLYYFHDAQWIDVKLHNLWLIVVSIALISVNDILATGMLSYVLLRGRMRVRKTDTLIAQVMAFSLNTGLLTTIGTVTMLLLVILSPEKLFYAALYICLSKATLMAKKASKSVDPRFAANGTFSRETPAESSNPLDFEADVSDEESSEHASYENDDDEEDMQESMENTDIAEGMDPEGFSGPSKIVKPLTKEALAAFKAAQERTGVIYISRIPPGMRPTKVRHLMSTYGEIGRVYLQQEDAKSAYLRRKYTSTKKAHFTEGWVEFKDKKVARSVAEMLNAQPIGGKKGTRWRDDVWTMKYLPKFKWNMLTEQVAHESAIHAARLRVELSQSRSEQRDYLKNVELARVLDKRRKQKGELPEPQKREPKRPAEGVEDMARKKSRHNEDKGAAHPFFLLNMTSSWNATPAYPPPARRSRSRSPPRVYPPREEPGYPPPAGDYRAEWDAYNRDTTLVLVTETTMTLTPGRTVIGPLAVPNTHLIMATEEHLPTPIPLTIKPH